MKYESWPLGAIPEHLRRPEPEMIRALGYDWKDPREINTMFENAVAEFAGSKYAVAVDCASNGLFLCMKYLNASGEVTIPSRTYCSVPQQIVHAGCTPVLEDIKWEGLYQLKPLPVYDASVRWKRNMYAGFETEFLVVSFQIKKRIPIGRSGIILTNDKEAASRIRLMSYDGRDLSLPYDHPEHFKCLGYHMYQIPEDAARGLILMNGIKDEGDSACQDNYPDLKNYLHLWK